MYLVYAIFIVIALFIGIAIGALYPDYFVEEEEITYIIED